ncbi:amino acid-binding protein [Halobellus limi]|uniref:ACT domain-containing protein n=1 Tax=Halobellus limi TaxID=699433 RepID=A0A1H5VXI7_9EURY|nr:ACT domain-containing protein [Halobellus limi]
MTSALGSDAESDAESDADAERASRSRGGIDDAGDAERDPQPHTIRLELADEPGQLLAALEPISENGGNLLSIFHERGNVTPRGRIPVEVDVEATPDRFDAIVDALREEGVNVVQAGAEHYAEEVAVLLVGHLVDTDLSDTLRRIEANPATSIADFSLNAPEGRSDTSSARLRMATRAGETAAALDLVRAIADEKDLHVVEPLAGGAV